MVSSLNLYFFIQAKCIEIFSADRFFYGFTASQSTLLPFRKYSVLHFACNVVFFLLFCNKVFLRLRRAVTIIIFHIIYLLMIFTHQYNWTFTAIKLRLFFQNVSIFFSAGNPQVIPLHINKDARFQKFGVCRKFFSPYIQGREISKYKRLKKFPLTINGHFAIANTKFLEKKFKTPSIYIGYLHTCLGGISLNFFKKSSYCNWKVVKENTSFLRKTMASPIYIGKLRLICGGVLPNF